MTFAFSANLTQQGVLHLHSLYYHVDSSCKSSDILSLALGGQKEEGTRLRNIVKARTSISDSRQQVIQQPIYQGLPEHLYYVCLDELVAI